jgi:small subunit ribosomal protein S35
MAAAVHSLRLSLRAAVRRTVAPTPAGPRQLFTVRRFSSSPFRPLPAAQKDNAGKDDAEVPNDEEGLDEDFEGLGLKLDVEEADALEDAVESNQRDFDEMDRLYGEGEWMPKLTRDDLFNEEDADSPDDVDRGMKDDEFDDDDMMSIAHGKLDELREYREYARIAAWQMPLLSSKTFARPLTSR